MHHAPTALDITSGRDLSGKNAIVTGGASGIGVETVRALARAGATVTIAARNEHQMREAATALLADLPDAHIETSPLDLASLASVRGFVERYLAMGRPLHLLINNAGVMATPFSRTAEGFEMQFGTNHLGHFALAAGLLPALRAAGPGARVVALTSIGHRRSDVDFDDPNFERRPYDPWLAYGQSKTANALFAVGFTRRYSSEGITANAVHPGGILTGLQKHMSREEQMALGWFDESGKLNERFKTPAQGASTTIWAAVAPELNGRGGLYLEDCRIASPWSADRPMEGYLPYALDPANAERLWDLSEALISNA